MYDLIKNELEDRRVLLLGFGREGRSSYSVIRRVLPNIPLTIADANPSVRDYDCLREDRNVTFRLGKDYLRGLKEFDRIMKSPGISLKDVRDDFQKDQITSQTDLFLRHYSSQVIGVTGTKGKSTTSTLIHHILKKSGRDAILLGNIGRPAFDTIPEIRKGTILVYELSSHQLEYISRAPHVAVLLNLYEEHLDAYRSFQDYQSAKMNIAGFQTAGDHFIYHEGDPRIKARIISMDLPGRRTPFSLTTKPGTGCYREADHLMYSSQGDPELILDLGPGIKLKGEHNLLNIMAAVDVTKILGLDSEAIAEGIVSFRGLEHRIEFCGEYKGIRFFNDSIATIPEACMEAVKALGDVDTLILGGHDRQVDYSDLARFLSSSSVRNFIFTGEAGRRILHEIKDLKRPDQNLFLIHRFDDFLEIAANTTKPGSICLLSPAAASYDEFMNFELRGKRFKELIGKLQTES